MGGSVGIGRNADFHSQMDPIFVDKDLRDAEILFRKEPSARSSFVHFIKSKAWLDEIEQLDQCLKDEQHTDNQGSTWGKFGYRDPFNSKNDRRSTSGSTLDNQSDQSPCGGEVAGASGSLGTKASEECTIINEQDYRAIVCAVLLPLYFKSLRRRPPEKPGERAAASAGKKKLEKSSTLKHARLRQILLNAVATINHDELDLFLANPEYSYSWVEWFKQAVVDMPVVLMVSSVDIASKESKIIFINRLWAEGTSSDAQGARTWSSTVGQDLHKVCAEDCPRGKSKILETAIFRGHLYKTSVAKRRACKLRAVVPVCSSRGDGIYAVALETPFFENPAHLEELGMYKESEKYFRQVEDLLALLPLLIKC